MNLERIYTICSILNWKTTFSLTERQIPICLTEIKQTSTIVVSLMKLGDATFLLEKEKWALVGLYVYEICSDEGAV